jgi:hypothetical protein
MYVAEMETEHYSFIALGKTRAEAMRALAGGWDKHAAQYGDAVAMSAERALDYYGANTFRLSVGGCARDYAELGHTPPAAPPEGEA